MTQQDLDDAVCAVTGEDLREIRRRGFSIADPTEVNFDPEPDDQPGQVLCWDDHHCGQPMPVVVGVDSFLPRRSA
ncbi:hypothetical protein [Lignipirellula cremea]|uniref:Uncharacterized protein n=1 Tax=Lignipirellula cremea TaxID=2528010 RepID=A0A518E3W7_9BACT|nr:hypothetical protein [Lignipirellula cremea]QDU98778.1 hypothetical protein Pla8534_66520 [Lignipirellula cremea]